MMHRNHRHPRHHRRSRGASLLDVAIGISLLAVTTIITSRFMVSLNDGSTAALSKAHARRVVTLVDQALKDDFAHINVCSFNRIGSPIVTINDPTPGTPITYGIAFYTDLPDETGERGTLDLVGWRTNGSTIQRTEVLNTGKTDTTLGCETLDLTGATWVDIAEPVLAPTDTTQTFFQGIDDGIDQSYGGTCSGNAAGNCNFDGIRVRFTLQPQGGSPTSFDEIYEIPTGTGRG